MAVEAEDEHQIAISKIARKMLVCGRVVILERGAWACVAAWEGVAGATSGIVCLLEALAQLNEVIASP